MNIWTAAKRLMDQFGRPVDQRKTPERKPLASVALQESVRDYVAPGLTPQRLAAVFREADMGDMARQAVLFDEIEERDGHLRGEKSKRENVITDIPLEVVPADDSQKAQDIAEFVEEWIDSQTDWEATLTAFQDAVGKGYAASEIHWDVSSGQAIPAGLEFIEQRHFVFVDGSGILQRYPRLMSDDGPVEIPPWKIAFHAYGGKSGHPTRSAIYRVCAWWWLFKNYAIKDWLTFAEVFGMPLRLGKYPPGSSSDDKKALKEAVKALGADAAGIISDTTQIEFVESFSGKTGGQVYEALAEYADKEMSLALVGQTLTADVGDVGSYAAAQVHNMIRQDLVRADARALAQTIRGQIIRPMVAFNFGWDAPCPKFEPDFSDEDDQTHKVRAEWITALLDRGVVMPLEWVREQFDIPEPDEGAETVGGMGGAAEQEEMQ